MHENDPEVYGILTERAGLVRAVVIVVAPVAGDDGLIHAFADQRHVPHVLGDDDWLRHLVHALLDEDGVALRAAAWGGCQGSGPCRIVSAAIQRHHRVRHWTCNSLHTLLGSNQPARLLVHSQTRSLKVQLEDKKTSLLFLNSHG